LGCREHRRASQQTRSRPDTAIEGHQPRRIGLSISRIALSVVRCGVAYVFAEPLRPAFSTCFRALESRPWALGTILVVVDMLSRLITRNAWLCLVTFGPLGRWPSSAVVGVAQSVEVGMAILQLQSRPEMPHECENGAECPRASLQTLACYILLSAEVFLGESTFGCQCS